MRQKDRFLFYIFLLFIFSLFGFQELVWRVCVRVVDGDTIVLNENETIRLIGVDTPETKDPRKSVQYFGQEAYEFTKSLVEGKKVRLEFDQDRIDKYGRTLGYVYLEDGTFVNAEIIKQGYGFAYTKYPIKYIEKFRQYEREARQNLYGLWADSSKQESASISTVTVYITKTGKKYHQGSCSSLAKSKIPISLKEACDKGYEPCSRCNPPKCN